MLAQRLDLEVRLICPNVFVSESSLEWFLAYLEIIGILEHAQYFFNQEFGYPDRINLTSTRLDLSWICLQ